MPAYGDIPVHVQIRILLTRFQPQTCYFRLMFFDEQYPNGSHISIPSPPNPAGIFDWEMPDNTWDNGPTDLPILTGSQFITPRNKPWRFGVETAFVRYPPVAEAQPILLAAPASSIIDIHIPQQGQTQGVNSRVRIAW